MVLHLGASATTTKATTTTTTAAATTTINGLICSVLFVLYYFEFDNLSVILI